MDFAGLLAALRNATKELPGMRAAWGVVVLALVAAVPVYLNGSGRAAVIAVFFAAAGFILVVLLMVLAKPQRRGQAQHPLLREALWMARALAYAFCLLIVLLIMVLVSGWPCQLAEMLGVRPSVFCSAPPGQPRAGVHIERTVDYSGSGCVQGRRVLREVVTDNLSFEGEVKEYPVQAFKAAIDSTELRVRYKLAGETVPVFVKWLPHQVNSERLRFPIKVNNKPVQVVYAWDQRPGREDDVFTAVAVASSLPILSLHASIILPPGKKILGPNPKYASFTSSMEERGCVLHLTQPATFECNQPLRNDTNVGMQYPVLWDVFDSCEPNSGP